MSGQAKSLSVIPPISFAYGKRGLFLAPLFPDRDVWLLFFELLYVLQNLGVSFRLQIIAMLSALLPIDAGSRSFPFFFAPWSASPGNKYVAQDAVTLSVQLFNGTLKYLACLVLLRTAFPRITHTPVEPRAIDMGQKNIKDIFFSGLIVASSGYGLGCEGEQGSCDNEGSHAGSLSRGHGAPFAAGVKPNNARAFHIRIVTKYLIEYAPFL